MLNAMIERRWLQRTRTRALVLTAKGRLKLAEHEISEAREPSPSSRRCS